MAARGSKRRGNTDYIVDNSARKETLKKRQKGLLKKLSEITTLCDVRACAVIYNPATKGQPDIFPANDPSVVVNMITEFNGLPEDEQNRRMFSQVTFLAERLKKAQEQLKRVRADNKEMRLSNTLSEYSDSTKSFDDLPISELCDLAKVNETNFRQVNHLINNNLMKSDSAAPAVPQSMADIIPFSFHQNIVGGGEGMGLMSINESMTNINPFPFYQNMAGGGEGMVYPGFMNQGNGLGPMSTNEPGFPAWFAELMRSSQNGDGAISNLPNIGSSSGSPSM